MNDREQQWKNDVSYVYYCHENKNIANNSVLEYNKTQNTDFIQKHNESCG